MAKQLLNNYLVIICGFGVTFYSYFQGFLRHYYLFSYLIMAWSQLQPDSLNANRLTLENYDYLKQKKFNKTNKRLIFLMLCKNY